MISLIYIEVLGYIALVLGVSSYLIKQQNTTRLTMGLAQAFMGLHFWLLGGLTAGVIQGVLALRTLASNYVKTQTARRSLFVVTVILCLILTAITWNGWKSIIPLLAGLNATYAICYLGNKKMRKMLILSSLLWLVNGIVWQSIPQIISEIIKVIFNIYTIFSMTKNREFTTETGFRIKEALPKEMTKEDLELEKELPQKV